MRLILLLFLSFSLKAMEPAQEVTKCELFDDLPVELKANVVMHLCDEVPAHSAMCYWHLLPKVIPVLQTCKRYYLHDIQFTAELLRRVNKKCRMNFFLLGLYVPTPACKRLLTQIKDVDGVPKKQFHELQFITLENKHFRMLDDIRNNRVQFKESTSNSSTPR